MNTDILEKYFNTLTVNAESVDTGEEADDEQEETPFSPTANRYTPPPVELGIPDSLTAKCFSSRLAESREPPTRKANSFRERRSRPKHLDALRKAHNRRPPRSASLEDAKKVQKLESPKSSKYIIREGRVVQNTVTSGQRSPSAHGSIVSPRGTHAPFSPFAVHSNPHSPVEASHHRSHSFKLGKKNTSCISVMLQDQFLDGSDFRPRTSSCPTRTRPRYHGLHPSSAEENNDDIYRVRCFTVSSKGEVMKRIDSMRARSNRSINSAHSSSSVGSSNHKECAGTSPGFNSRASTPHSEQGDPSGRGLIVTFILGYPGVGKTSLVNQFMTSDYMNAYESECPSDGSEKAVSVQLDGEESDIIFHEMGREMFEADFTEMKAEADCYVIVYSITDRRTFEEAVDILYQLHEREEIKSKATILVGNKSDVARGRSVSHEEAVSIAKTYGCKLSEVSAGINHRVDELLVGIVKQTRIKEKIRIKEKGARKTSTTTCPSGAKILLDKIFHSKHAFTSRSCENLYN